jgi:hypothetical protein
MAESRAGIQRFQQIPNVGPAIEGDLRILGFDTPQALIGQDPYALFERLCAVTGQRHDPCVIDVLIAAVRFMEGGAEKPWWTYTAQRKAHISEFGSIGLGLAPDGKP